uniref:Mitotic-spindle organizing protein 1B-like n=1 Tax=Rhizophora mucronata TaxID=61149 RepID=A0A2P2II30_RHIMU
MPKSRDSRAVRAATGSIWKSKPKLLFLIRFLLKANQKRKGLAGVWVSRRRD